MDWTLPENLAELKRLAERATQLRRNVLWEDQENFYTAAREALPQLIEALEKERGR